MYINQEVLTRRTLEDFDEFANIAIFVSKHGGIDVDYVKHLLGYQHEIQSYVKKHTDMEFLITDDEDINDISLRYFIQGLDTNRIINNNQIINVQYKGKEIDSNRERNIRNAYANIQSDNIVHM